MPEWTSAVKNVIKQWHDGWWYKVNVWHQDLTVGWAFCTQLWISSETGEEQQ